MNNSSADNVIYQPGKMILLYIEVISIHTITPHQLGKKALCKTTGFELQCKENPGILFVFSEDLSYRSKKKKFY